MLVKLSKLYTRARRKLLKSLRELIYFNYEYHPTGIYHSTQEYVASQDENVAYKEIYPDLVTELAISAELYLACSDYMKPLLHVKATYFVVAIPQGRVHTDNAISVAVLSHTNKIIADISFSYNLGKVVKAQENSIFKQKYFTKPDQYKGTIFTLLTGGSGTDNYFHWLIDVLPRLHLLKESGWYEQVDYFLVPAYKYDYQQQTLQLLGIAQEKIIEADKHAHIVAHTIIASNAPRSNYSLIPHWVCTFLRSSFLKQPLLQHTYPPLVYISRKDSQIRKIKNETAVITLLARYGFHTFVLSELSFSEQVSLFASAEIIVAPHGAGLINLVFCKKETHVLELFAQGYVKASYYDLSQKVGLIHTHLICKGSKVKTAKEGMKLNMTIDLIELEATLYQVMAQKSRN